MPTLSYCCIFKNEEKHLPKWIECAKAIACDADDEIIACDTGSTDNSCRLLREAGIEPIYFEWINDFSAAKNFVIEKAKGDWILFLDCDEYFDEKSVPFVRKVIESADKDEKAMLIQSYMHNINEDDNNRLISTCFHWRIFRNNPLVRYTEAIHEYVNYFGEEKANLVKSELLILHTGYSTTLAKLKGERNLEYLEAEIAQNETDELTTQQAFYMANTYAQMGDMLKAAEYADIAVQGSDKELGFMTVKMYRDILLREQMKEGGGDFNKKIDILDRALLRAPDQPDFLIDKMQLYLTKDYFYEVELMCHKIIEQVQNPEIMGKYESNAQTLMYYVYIVLSNMKFRRGDTIEARRYAFLALKENPERKEFLTNFVKCFRYEELSIIKPIIDQIYPAPTKEDKTDLKNYFAAMNFGETYLHYAKPKSGSFEYLVSKGLYAKALKLCEKELLELFKYAAFCYSKYPRESQILRAAAPEKYLFGTKKAPKGEMTLEELMNRFVEVFSKIILVCFSMTDEEFEFNKKIVSYLASPTKDFLLAGFNQATQGVQQSDTETFYKYIAPRGNKTCTERLAKVVCMMPVNDDFLYAVVKDMMVYKELQGAYNLVEKIENKDFNYHFLRGIVLLYAGEQKLAREAFIKARAIGPSNHREVRDFIKMTDPAGAIAVTV